MTRLPTGPKAGPHRNRLGPKLLELDPHLVKWANCGRACPKSGRHRPSLVEISPALLYFGLNLVDIGRSYGSVFSRNRVRIAQHRPNFAELGPTRIEYIQFVLASVDTHASRRVGAIVLRASHGRSSFRHPREVPLSHPPLTQPTPALSSLCRTHIRFIALRAGH